MISAFSNKIKYKSKFGQINYSNASGHYDFKGATTGLALKYVVEGQEEYFINGQSLVVSAGQFLVVRPDVHFEAQPKKNDKETKGLCIDLSRYLLPLKNSRVLTNNFLFDKSFEFLTSTTVGWHLDRAGTILKSNTHSEFTFDFLQQLSHGLHMFSEDVFFRQKELYNVAKKELTREAILMKMLQAKEYVLCHYKGQILLSNLAQHVGMSKFQLLKMFKICFHCTPQQMQMTLRMNQAKMLLASDKLSISQMAIDLGYFDLAAFSKAFKAYYGVAPTYFKN